MAAYRDTVFSIHSLQSKISGGGENGFGVYFEIIVRPMSYLITLSGRI